ncbi:RING-type domain-containing protein [Psidium guajava]|nr:RING-type domain-containing protein [Psidium guajava]
MQLLGESMGMVSDSVANASSLPLLPISKDFAKKKRANRSAKLKQCKLDARREQWLSQSKKKQGKEAWDGCREPRNESYCAMGNANMTRMAVEEHYGPFNREGDSEFRANSPVSFTCALGKHESGSDYGVSSTSCTSSTGCCSGSITEEEDGDDECLDDWEAVADALAANENRSTLPFDPSPEEEPICRSQSRGVIPNESERSTCEGLTTDSKFAPANSRAWRPDDAFRPQSLPNLLKQHCCSNPKWRHGDGGVPWFCPGVLTVPTSCPICYEDLDLTDSSFLPCFCGFRLCLFCHKRVLEEDCRCPGCRRPYERDPAKVEESLQGGFGTSR